MADSAAALGVAREPRRGRAASLDVARLGRAPSDVRAGRPRPGDRHDLGGAAHARSPAPQRARAPRRARVPEGHGPARDPGVDPDRARADVRRDPRLGRSGSRAIIGAVAGELVSWEWERRERVAARPGSTTPRTRSTRRSSRRTASARPPGAPVSVPIEWEELDDPDLRPDRVDHPRHRRTPRGGRRPDAGRARRRPAAPDARLGLATRWRCASHRAGSEDAPVGFPTPYRDATLRPVRWLAPVPVRVVHSIAGERVRTCGR